MNFDRKDLIITFSIIILTFCFTILIDIFITETKWLSAYLSGIMTEIVGGCITFLALVIWFGRKKTTDTNNLSEDEINQVASKLKALLSVPAVDHTPQNNIDLSSNVWFDKIISNLKNTEKAVIYLNTFLNPDDASPKHKAHIQMIMDELAKLIYNYRNNIKIVAFIPKTQTNRNGKIWLIGKISQILLENNKKEKADVIVNQSLTIIDSQIVADNTSSAYILNENMLLFSQKVNQKRQYFELPLGGVLPKFIQQGLEFQYQNQSQ